ncbi:Gti1/Pac2 family-domain-containing protein [Amylocystis lapponica]|nr:Gti1/Pac2 family-domain-containing protein [Amylocystis lapponica]
MFYNPAQDLQHPTHPRLHVRDARDAHIVFEAVRRGLLKPVVRRLNELERSMYITSGAIFIWEESDEDIGLKRWTDGRVWSQSRMREPYLFYDEKVSADEHHSQPSSRRNTYRFVDGPSRTWSSSAQSHYDRSDHHPTGLVKQAYSAWVATPPNGKPRKWHLTAYFTYADLPNIPTVDADPMLRTLSVPTGVYRSGKARSRIPESGSRGSPPQSLSPSPMTSMSSIAPESGARDAITLPSLHTTITGTQLVSHDAQNLQRTPACSRSAEDQRMIRLLNSRPI